MTESEWLACTDPHWMVEFLRVNGMHRTKRGRRKLRSFGCCFARRVWQLMSERGRNWLNLGETCVEGLLTPDERRLLESEDEWLFEEPIEVEELEQWRVERAADHAGWYTLSSNIMTAAMIPAHSAATAIGIKAVPSGRSGVEHDAERKAQTFLLRDICRHPFRPITINPAWRTPTVTSLATAAYNERALPSGELDFALLAVLADALEETGCDNADILNHCRQAGEHVRGCWVVDLLLGKE